MITQPLSGIPSCACYWVARVKILIVNTNNIDLLTGLGSLFYHIGDELQFTAYYLIPFDSWNFLYRSTWQCCEVCTVSWPDLKLTVRGMVTTGKILVSRYSKCFLVAKLVYNWNISAVNKSMKRYFVLYLFFNSKSTIKMLCITSRTSKLHGWLACIDFLKIFWYHSNLQSNFSSLPCISKLNNVYNL